MSNRKPLIYPESMAMQAAALNVSPQRIWQMRMHAEGRCEMCGKQPLATHYFCERHRLAQNKKKLAYYYRRKAKQLTAAVTTAVVTQGTQGLNQ